MATIDDIQKLQFTNLAAAEAMTLNWLCQELKVNATSVELTPKATSLNSFNGFATIDDERLFFKSHVEPNSMIAEFYNAKVLADAGYNIVEPIRTIKESGQQIVFYPVITEPVMFDLMRAIELGDTTRQQEVLTAEKHECELLLDIYKSHAKVLSPEKAAEAPIHQLFAHRLFGERFNSFYADSYLTTPNGTRVHFQELLQKRFIVNHNDQQRTLHDLIEEARVALDPTQSTFAIPGHGDAHFGNVFLQNDRYLYFDPAFGGWHSPLLDAVKPLYHNVFAQWMYFPEEKAAQLQTSVTIDKQNVVIEYDHYIPPIREQLLDIKLHTLIRPLRDWLSEVNQLPYGLRPFELALMCCPLLTMNLTDDTRFPPATAWTGLAQTLQLGNWDSIQNFRLRH